jgi:hypothetical protein
MTEACAKKVAVTLEQIFRRLVAEGRLLITADGEVECAELSATAADDPTVKAGNRKRGAVVARSEVSA